MCGCGYSAREVRETNKEHYDREREREREVVLSTISTHEETIATSKAAGLHVNTMEQKLHNNDTFPLVLLDDKPHKQIY